MPKLTLPDLNRELNEWGKRFPQLKKDELFVAWFLRAYATDEEKQAVNALTGKAGDKGADAIFIDDKLKAVFIVQGKLRQTLMKTQEKHTDVMGFAQLSLVIRGDEDGWRAYNKGLAPEAAHRMSQARERVRKRGYRLTLCFVTTGRVSAGLIVEARRKAAEKSTSPLDRPTLTVVDGRDTMDRLSEYFDGLAPAVPSLDLPLEDCHSAYRVEGVESWTGTMSGHDVARMYDQAGIKLFAQNIRGFLGMKTKVAHQMAQTLSKEPRSFWYLNNGITIVCKDARLEQEGGRQVLAVKSPQVINGLQTTMTIVETAPKDAAKASVSVRVISVPRESTDEYDRLVSQIVRATNSQNEIKSADLMSNDSRQVNLERELGRLNYLYVRKRQSTTEARRVNFKYIKMITKEELANAFASCLEPSLPRRVGLQPLFEEPYYKRVFGDRRYSAKQYLCRYWHYRNIQKTVHRKSGRTWARFVVVYFLWDQFGADIQSNENNFLSACEARSRFPKFHTQYQRLIDTTFDSALRFYRKEPEVIEMSPFFKRADTYERFEKFWRSAANTSLRQKFKGAAARFRELLSDPT